MTENVNILDEAKSIVTGDRRKDYGHPLDGFTRVAKMWSVILGHEVSADQVGLCMCALKISRQVHSPKRDNLVDLAGYAYTLQAVADEQYRRHTLKETFAPISELGFSRTPSV